MIIYDPLYGKFSIPKKIVPLIKTPEFRRLSQIRLLNTLTPTLATLGELRRYSHTLGVLYLEKIWELKIKGEYSRNELDALQASIILHDIGTPPFGHLFEYILREKSGWNHEDVIVDILSGTHAPENIAHQIFASKTLKAVKEIEKSGIELEIVVSILSGNHPLSQLILGRIDFDNIDNVMRMAWALGIAESPKLACNISENISVNRKGKVLFPRTKKYLIEQWLQLRKASYDIIVFDTETVAAQAILSKAIDVAMSHGELTQSEWSLTDESLLALLQDFDPTKRLISSQYLGVLPNHILTIQFHDIKLDKKDKSNLSSRIEDYLILEGIKNCFCYTFLDKGTFEKSFSLCDPETMEEWNIGEQSNSVIIYIFTTSTKSISALSKNKIIHHIQDILNVGFDKIQRISGINQDYSMEQKSIDF